MSDFPDVHFGSADSKPADWRKENDDSLDDDEELKETPSDVVEMLGFDPKEYSEDRLDSADIEHMANSASLDDILPRCDGLCSRLDALISRRDSENVEPGQKWITISGAHILVKGSGSDAKIISSAGGKFNGKTVGQIEAPSAKAATVQSPRKLNQSEKSSLQKYTLSGSYPINEYLRNGTQVEKGRYANATPIRSQKDMREAIAGMDEVFENASIDKETTVFRGVNEAAWEKIKKQAASGMVEDAGFVSTTTDKKSVTGSSLTHWMTITVPKGAKAIPLDGDIANRTKNEVLLNRGTKFRVVKLTARGVTLEVVP